MLEVDLTALGLSEKRARRAERFLVENRRGLVVGIVVILGASAVFPLLAARARSHEQHGWAAYASAARAPDAAKSMEDTARRFAGTPVEPWSLLTAASEYAREGDLKKASSLAGEVRTRFSSHFLSKSAVFASVSPVEALEAYVETEAARESSEGAVPAATGGTVRFVFIRETLEVKLYSEAKTLTEALWGTDGTSLAPARLVTFAPSGICFGKWEVAQAIPRSDLRDTAITLYKKGVYHRCGTVYFRVPSRGPGGESVAEPVTELEWGICFEDYPGLDGNAVPVGTVSSMGPEALRAFLSAVEKPPQGGAADSSTESSELVLRAVEIP